jgi:hypothetical protein
VGPSAGKVYYSRLKTINIIDDSIIFDSVNQLNSDQYEDRESNETVEEL